VQAGVIHGLVTSEFQHLLWVLSVRLLNLICFMVVLGVGMSDDDILGCL
jgi:hypothetical protein